MHIILSLEPSRKSICSDIAGDNIGGIGDGSGDADGRQSLSDPLFEWGEDDGRFYGEGTRGGSGKGHGECRGYGAKDGAREW